ncbi:MAG TPA: flagellar biosynthesis protein FlgL, partial [Myxococcota bacterium]
MMRVSDLSMFNGARDRVATSKAKMDVATEQASTGLRVEHASDDPAAAARMVKARMEELRHDNIASTVSQASDELGAVDGALGQASNLLVSGISLAVQMASSSVTSPERVAAGEQAGSLLDSVVGALNVELGGRFLLAGFKDSAPPFAASGYSGDDGVRTAEIAPGVVEPTSIRADSAVLGTGVTGGVDVLGALRDLKTALENDDIPSVRAQIDVLQKAQAQISAAQTA